MTLPSENTIRASRTALKSMADRDTPFIYNEWYVAALSDEIGRNLVGRKILGKRIVLFRTEAGLPIALDDRCAHRSFPLSAGAIEGDTIVCGYHGFRYNSEGTWIEVPSQSKCPKGIGVRSYKLVERGPLIWIWMGDPAKADVASIPDLAWMFSKEWEYTTEKLEFKGNYVILHENLIDLTHLSYLHADSFGTPEYARAPFNVEIRDSSFAVTRLVVPTPLPPVWRKAMGLGDTKTAARFARSQFVTPALHLTSGKIYESTLPEEQRKYFQIRTAHLVTPVDRGETRYFTVFGRDFGHGDPDLRAFYHNSLCAIVEEDRVGLQLLEPVLEERDDEFFEVSVASDAAAVAMRRYLKTRAHQEMAERSGAAETHQRREPSAVVA